MNLLSRFYFKSILSASVAVLLIACGSDSDPDTNNNENNDEQEICSYEMPAECVHVANAAQLVDTALDSPCYHVDGALRIEQGAIEVEPGTTLYFAQNSGLDLREGAELVALGEEDRPICMFGDSTTRGHWRGISLVADAKVTLDHVRIEHSGSEGWGTRKSPADQGAIALRGENVEAVVSNSTFRDNALTAINAVNDSSARLSVSSSTFENNETPLQMQIRVADGLSDDLEFINNDDDAVLLHASGRQNHTFETDIGLAAIEVPYRVLRTVEFSEGSLTLAAGTTVEFGTDLVIEGDEDAGARSGIDVSGQGSFTAVGTEDAPIVLRGATAERGHWRGIRLETESMTHRLEHITLEHAGSQPWTLRRTEQNHGGLVVAGDGTSVSISQSTFRENAFAAVQAKDSDASIMTIDSTRFESNERALVMRINQIENVSTDVEIEGNDLDAIVVKAVGPLTHVVTSNATWPAFTVPYFVDETIEIEAGAEVQIEPNAVFEFAEEEGMRVEGTLTAVGTEDEPIILRGHESDAGYWRGLYFSNPDVVSTLNHIEISDGGGYQWHVGRDASVGNIALASAGSGTCGAEATVDVSNARISNSGLHGIAIRFGSLVTSNAPIEFEDIPGYEVLYWESIEDDPDYSEIGGCYLAPSPECICTD